MHLTKCLLLGLFFFLPLSQPKVWADGVKSPAKAATVTSTPTAVASNPFPSGLVLNGPLTIVQSPLKAEDDDSIGANFKKIWADGLTYILIALSLWFVLRVFNWIFQITLPYIPRWAKKAAKWSTWGWASPKILIEKIDVASDIADKEIPEGTVERLLRDELEKITSIIQEQDNVQ